MSPKRKRSRTCCMNIDLSEANDEHICSQSDVIARYNLQKAKLEALSTQKNSHLNIEFVEQELTKLSSELQTLKATLNELENLNAEVDCKTTDLKELSDVCKVQSTLSQDLSNLMRHECHLKRQLEQARTSYRNAKIEDQLLSEELKRVGEKCWNEYALRQSMLAQQRLIREQQATKNASHIREVTIASVANSITSHVLLKLPSGQQMAKKHVHSTKSVKRILGKHIMKMFQKVREQQVIALTDVQVRERRQLENLWTLKRDLDEIRKSLRTKNNIKRIHDDEIALEKQEVKDLLTAQGANPYLGEYLLAVEEKQREAQRKMLVEEQKRLLDMQREYSRMEANKIKEEAERKKWDEYWAKRANEKVQQKKQEEYEKYYDNSANEEEETGHAGIHQKQERGSGIDDHDHVQERKSAYVIDQTKKIKSEEAIRKSKVKSEEAIRKSKVKSEEAIRKSKVTEPRKSKRPTKTLDGEHTNERKSAESETTVHKSEPERKRTADSGQTKSRKKSGQSDKGSHRKSGASGDQAKKSLPEAEHATPGKMSLASDQTETQGSPNKPVSEQRAEQSSQHDSSEKKADAAQGEDDQHVVPTRQAVHLDVDQKQSLLNMADEHTNKAVLMDGGRNVFDFGDVKVGERKYSVVSMANIGSETVKLKMSVLNPYGPFTFCNALREIPPDSYYSLKYKFEPTEPGQVQETVKIEEVGKRENFIIVKLRGHGSGRASNHNSAGAAE